MGRNKMKILITILLALFISSTASAREVGTYQMVAIPPDPSGFKGIEVYILNTKTGEVRGCYTHSGEVKCLEEEK
jgi:hypothetical protein